MGAADFRTFVPRRSKQDGFNETVEHGPVRTVKRLTARFVDWPNADEAFSHAVDSAAHEHGHGGYTGTLAEKREFRMLVVPAGQTPEQFMDALQFDYGENAPKIPGFNPFNDKWGPAGCIEVAGPDGGWHFFGSASC